MSRGLTAAFGSLFVPGSCCYLQRIGAGPACRPNCALLKEAWSRGGPHNPISGSASLSVATVIDCHAAGARHRKSDNRQAGRGLVLSSRFAGWFGRFCSGYAGIPASLSSTEPASRRAILIPTPINPSVGALSYETALEDPLLAEIGFAVVSELKTETSTGGLLVGALAPSLAARLVQKYSGASSLNPFLARQTMGSIGADCLVCWTTSKQTSKAISASIAWHRLRA